MGQFALENETPFAAEPLALADEAGRPLLVLVIKATYEVDRKGLRLAEEQAPVNIEGEHWGKPEESSYKYEPECAFIKMGTDVVLIGHAHAPASGTTELLVALQVGPLRKGVRVVGDRVWFKSVGSVSMTKPRPFERIPLVYERAFGGWDRSHPESSKHSFEARNPVGVGFRASPKDFEEGLRLPNLEDPLHPLKRFGDVVPPAGFGFISPHWQPRAAFAGTYDEAWKKQRAPLLPRDFDRRFFSAASAGMVSSAFLRGDEEVVITHASPHGRLSFRLPGQLPPEVIAELASGEDVKPPMHLDTVTLDMDAHRAFLMWRGHLPLLEGLHDVRELKVSAQRVEARMARTGT
jgi:hypothetical protein